MCHNNKQTRQWPFVVMLSMVLFLVVGISSASKEDTQQPINIEADRAEISEAKGMSTYTGNVILSQGGIEIKAEIVVVYARDGQLQRITAEGNPVHYQQQRSNEKDVLGVSQRMEYTAETKRLLLLGNAELWQGINRFSGHRIQYDPEKEQVIASGNNTGEHASTKQDQQRVTVTLQPKKKTSASQQKENTQD